MGDRAMGEVRGIANVQWPPDGVDIWKCCARGGDAADTPRRYLRSPGGDREANGGM